MKDITSMIIAYEEGTASEKEVIKLFQRLVNTGQAWRLQGAYGRTAMALLKKGIIVPPKVKTGMTKFGSYGEKISYPKITKAKVRKKLLKGVKVPKKEVRFLYPIK